MSWSASFDTREAFESDTPTFASPALAEIQANQPTLDQYIAARKAAELLLHTPGVVPDDSFDVRVNLSGHANPDHKPATGWANDCITVSVTQK